MRGNRSGLPLEASGSGTVEGTIRKYSSFNTCSHRNAWVPASLVKNPVERPRRLQPGTPWWAPVIFSLPSTQILNNTEILLPGEDTFFTFLLVCPHPQCKKMRHSLHNPNLQYGRHYDRFRVSGSPRVVVRKFQGVVTKTSILLNVYVCVCIIIIITLNRLCPSVRPSVCVLLSVRI